VTLFATAAGVRRLHVEKVLNHEIDDVAEIYDRLEHAAEKATALETCGRTLGRLLRGPAGAGALVDPRRRPAKLHALEHTEPPAALSP
jgi:hypothetical protein